MKIVFATPQSLQGSTMVGRVLPIAQILAQRHSVSVLCLRSPASTSGPKDVNVVEVGREPFVRTPAGKRRAQGLQLIALMLGTALRTAWHIIKLKPDVVIIVKPLPANVAGVLLAQAVRRPRYLVLDVDDFELTANTLSSLSQRAAIHWSERAAARYARAIIAATPFLADHFEQLKPRQAHIHLIPTGVKLSISKPLPLPASSAPTLLYIGSVSLASGHRVDLLPAILQQVQQTSPTARLIVAGSGDDVTLLKKKCEELGVAAAVEWTGRFPLAEVPALIARSHVLLDPVDVSITVRAKSSFRVIAAAVAGRPVVTSNVGVRPYLLPTSLHQRSFAQPASSADYAAHCLDFMAKPLSEAEQQALHQHGQKFQWTALAEQYAQCLQYAE